MSWKALLLLILVCFFVVLLLFLWPPERTVHRDLRLHASLQEEEAQSRKARAAAVAEGRKEREAGRRKALARKTPVTAIMSQQQRARVEDVLAQLRDTHLPGALSTSTGAAHHPM